MPVTLNDAAAYIPRELERNMLAEITRTDPWVEEILAQARRKWEAKPWHERAWIRTRNWLHSHTPHVHIYLGDHPEERDG
jgi:hypothetical protein